LLRYVLATTFALALFGSVCVSQTVLCTEDPVSGCVAGLTVGNVDLAITVASDGESSFDPFGAGYDTSDGIQFNDGYTWVMQSSVIGWQQINSTTWVLPADLTSIGCGRENETTCEPVGAWYLPNAWWYVPATKFDIMDPDGSLSDVVWIDNKGPGGFAELHFASLPETGAGVMGLLSLGLIGLTAAARRRRA